MMRNIFIDDWMDRGRLIGLQQGVLQGAHEKAVETARGMLSYGIPKNKVAEISALSLAEVQKIADEIQTI